MFYYYRAKLGPNVRYVENTELKVISMSLEVVSMSFKFFQCFYISASYLVAKFNEVLVMHSRDRGPFDTGC